MKKFLSISLIFLLTIVITYAGSGINAYSFCCEDCHTIGVEVILGDKCCDIHQDECSSELDNFNNDICETSHGECSLERLNIDLQSAFSDKSPTELATKVLDIYLTTLRSYIIQNTQDITIIGYISQTQKPPNLSNFVYFSLLETLII